MNGGTTADNPDVELGPQAALSFSMAFHELLTNAAKYGALSNADGRVEITWSIERRDKAEILVASWRETGGPPISNAASERTGFGSRLIATSLSACGEIDLAYEPDGLVLVAESQLAKLQFRNDLGIDESGR
ncbi:sensor histidine kinase [Shinella curvata]|uniref:histidine kinase n=1 Tax=Shinella curvata TaxID=1817964 RepID=A0ABT8XKF5_9HYPH|nr:sensor histidine kinase [Shinella curvata]MCJ8056877.1 sensor histidine kinase [Shinella curvata]MDO6124212.1 sensor histidine kinase [Shinella curvata]